jgi:uncharacterized MAPEG superfamily protein
MTIELALLLASLPVYGLYLGVQSLIYRHDYGVLYAATARDDPRPPGALLSRAERALRNFHETWPVFIVLALVAHLAAPGDALVFWGAIVWLAGRVVYLPLYLLGVFAVRSIVWSVATLGLGAMLWGVLF